jgi:hypothetical protein
MILSRLRIAFRIRVKNHFYKLVNRAPHNAVQFGKKMDFKGDLLDGIAPSDFGSQAAQSETTFKVVLPGLNQTSSRTDH